MRLRPLALLGALLLAGCGSEPSAPDEARFERRFLEVWERVDRVYPMFGQKGVDWAAARERHLPAARRARSQEELAEAVRALLAELRDGHVYLVRPDGSQLPAFALERRANWDHGVWQRYLGRARWRQGVTNWGWGRFGEVGYLAIGGFNPEQVKLGEVEAALDSLREARALVVDLRANGGGDSRLSDPLAARFADRERVWGYVQERTGARHADLSAPAAVTLAPRGWRYARPVFVLVGRRSFSSTERFVSQVREYPQVTVVGDTTGGSTGNPGFHDLGDGWQYTVSRSAYYTAERVPTEDLGIPPDVVVPAGPDDFARGVDPVLEYALERAAAVGAGARQAALHPPPDPRHP